MTAQSHFDDCGSGCHLGPSVQNRQGHWLPSDRTLCDLTWWVGGVAGTTGRGPSTTCLSCLRPQGLPSREIQRTRDEAGTHPGCRVWNVNCISLCRIQEHFGCHPRARALLEMDFDLGLVKPGLLRAFIHLPLHLRI